LLSSSLLDNVSDVLHERRVVGVDIDGVLGNQVHGVLERVNARLSRDFRYEHVVHWDVPFGVSTSFVPEVKAAMGDPRYVLEMPVHEGAAKLLEALRDRYVVKIITVRPVEVIPLTERWLRDNGLAYDELVFAEEALKSRHGADVLIDDYPKNLVEFLDSGSGFGLLVDQPWNQEVFALGTWLESPRLGRVTRLADVLLWLESVGL
jgi:5'(3')-deoxyribonucleotidase